MMAQSDLVKFEDFFKLTTRYGFRFVGLNPYFECKSEVSKGWKWINVGIFNFCLWSLVITVILEFMFVLSIFGDLNQYMEFCKTLSGVAYDMMGAELLILMWTSGDQFNEFILQLEKMFPSDHLSQLRYGAARQARTTQRTLQIITFAFFICLFTWVVITPTYDILFCYFTGTKYVLELPFSIWMPKNVDPRFTFIFAFSLELAAMYGSVMIILSVNMLYVAIVNQIQLQFEILGENIRKLPPNDSSALNQIIRQHILLIDIGQHFAMLISRSVFINHLLSTLGICCGLFELALSDEIFQYVVYLFAMTIQTFSLSFVGDMMMQSSLKVADAVYESNWTDSSPKIKLTLLQIIHRSQRPLTVRGLGFFTLSLESFKKILTTSFSYYALLKSFID